MVEMEVCEQNMELFGQVVLHRHAERPHSGAGIEDERMTA